MNIVMQNFKQNKEEHLAQTWIVHQLTYDFKLWDVWYIAFEDSSKNVNFNDFHNTCYATLNAMSKQGSFAAFFVHFRNFMSKVLPLDKNVNTLPIPGCTETSIRDRITDKNILAKDGYTKKDVGSDLRNIFHLKNESFNELSNNTVHSAIHLGIVKGKEKTTGTLAIYTKARGRWGRFYLGLIAPFRTYIIYPYLIKNIKKNVEQIKINNQ